MSEKSADTIRNFLNQHNVTISEFAKVADISRTSVHKYLSGTRIHPKTARKIEKRILDFYRVFLPYENLID